MPQSDSSLRRSRLDALVSVVVPCYGVVEHIDECVESALGQTHRSIEVVLVDDGSTDGTAERIARWTATDERVRAVSHGTNRGLGAARNSGVDVSTGDYLFFLDADDVLPADALERMVASTIGCDAEIVSGVVARVDSTGEARAAQYRKPFDTDKTDTHIFSEPELVYDQMACSKLYSRTFWYEQHLEFPEGVLYEDVALVMRAHCSATSVNLISEPTYRWRRRESGNPSITQDRYRVGSVAARFSALASADAYLRDHASERVWEEHGVKIMTVDIRLYSRLLADGGDEFIAEFIGSAGAVADAMSQAADERLTPVMREVRRALLDRDVDLVVRCAPLFSGAGHRDMRASIDAAATLLWSHPSSVGRIGLGEIARFCRRVATRIRRLLGGSRPTPC